MIVLLGVSTCEIFLWRHESPPYLCHSSGSLWKKHSWFKGKTTKSAKILSLECYVLYRKLMINVSCDI